MSSLLALVAVLAQLVWGGALLRLLCPALAGVGTLGRLGLGYGLGLIAVAVVSVPASMLGARRMAPSVAIATAITVVLAIRMRTRTNSAIEPSPRQLTGEPGWQRLLGVALIVCLAGWVTLLAATCLLEPIVEWDVIAIWAFKAKILLHETISSTAYFDDPRRAYSHPDYPLLWPLNMAWIWSVVGQTDLVAVKLLGVALLTAFVCGFHGILARTGDRLGALLVTCLLVSIPMFQTQLVRMMADVPLAFFTFVFVACCYEWLSSGDRDSLRLAGVFAVGCILTKSEGLALWGLGVACTLVAVLVPRGRSRLRPALKWLLAVPVLASGPWLLLRMRIPALHENYAARLTPAQIWEHTDRVPQILKGAWMYLGATADWLYFWPLLLAVLVITSRRWIRTSCLFLFAFAQLSLLLYGLVYVVTPWNLAELMEVSLSRIALHVFPVECLLLFEVARTGGLFPWRAEENLPGIQPG